MKKFFLLVCLFSIYSFGANGVPKWSIVDIYSMAQQATVSNLNHPIYRQTLKKDKWVSTTPAWNIFIDAIVDEKNDYIYILDEGTGGGSLSTQAAMWRDGAGGILLIVSENIHDFTLQERSLLKAFQYTPTSLGIKLVTPPIQKVSLLDFMPKTMSMKDLRILEKIRPNIYYKLPRKGTSIHALLVIKEKGPYNEKISKEREKALRYYHHNLKGKIFRNIELAWEDNRFKIRKKSRKEPTKKDIWPDQ